MKIKRTGFVLFIYWEGDKNKRPIEIGQEFCKTETELKDQWSSHWDDKWDLEGRHKIHYFYLDIAKNKYFPLKKWKNDINTKDRFKSDDETELSNKMF